MNPHSWKELNNEQKFDVKHRLGGLHIHPAGWDYYLDRKGNAVMRSPVSLDEKRTVLWDELTPKQAVQATELGRTATVFTYEIDGHDQVVAMRSALGISNPVSVSRDTI